MENCTDCKLWSNKDDVMPDNDKIIMIKPPSSCNFKIIVLVKQKRLRKSVIWEL